MQLDDKILADVIKIFHNAKGSVLNNIYQMEDSNQIRNKQPFEQWQKQHRNSLSEHITTRQDSLSKLETYNSKKQVKQESPSIFGNQPISEFAQQPGNQSNNKKRHKQEEISEAEIEDQLTDEQRTVLEGHRRDEDIEQRRSSYEGFAGDQR